MVATWLTELQLDQINQALLNEEGEGGTECQVLAPLRTASSLPSLSIHPSPLPLDWLLGRELTCGHGPPLAPQGLIEQLRTFLTDYKDVLDETTTSGLLASYGRLDELLHFAAMHDDNETVIEHLMQRGEVRGPGGSGAKGPAPHPLFFSASSASTSHPLRHGSAPAPLSRLPPCAMPCRGSYCHMEFPHHAMPHKLNGVHAHP